MLKTGLDRLYLFQQRAPAQLLMDPILLKYLVGVNFFKTMLGGVALFLLRVAVVVLLSEVPFLQIGELFDDLWPCLFL